MVGKGAVAESVAIVEVYGKFWYKEDDDDDMAEGVERVWWKLLVLEPDKSMAAAAEVVAAIAVADGGRGWLWFPSYVVVKMVVSSAHLWTCLRTGHPTAMVQR